MLKFWASNMDAAPIVQGNLQKQGKVCPRLPGGITGLPSRP